MTQTAAYPITDFVPANIDATRWETLQPLYEALLQRELSCGNCLEQLLLDQSELDAAANETLTTLYINMTCHTDDEEVRKAYLAFIENVEPKLKQVRFELDRKIAQCPHAEDLDAQRFRVLLRDTRADVELFREENVALQTDDAKLAQKYSELCGAMTVDYDGRVQTLSQMARYLEETDRKVREAAWTLVTERRYRDCDRINDLFDQMITLRHQVAQNAGFTDYRGYIFKARHRFDYSIEDCTSFHDAIEQCCVPLLRELNTQRGGALNVSPLRPWDLGVDVKGRAPLRPFETCDNLVAGCSRLFHRMEPALGDLFNELCGGGSLDLDSRTGKAPGGYQACRERVRRPFIFMNAAGMQRDLETMIHEAGHAFHSMLSRNEPLLHYREAPIEFAEVASMSMELLASPFIDEFYTDAGANRARRRHLEEMIRLLPWIATIDAFQHWLYANPEHTRDQRNAYWLELDERFGPAVDWTGLEEFRATQWHRQIHLFEVPFYYVEYGIAQLGALGMWLQSRENPKTALAHYTNALKLGGSRPLPDLFAAAGLTFEFGADTVKRLMDAVQEELGRLPE